MRSVKSTSILFLFIPALILISVLTCSNGTDNGNPEPSAAQLAALDSMQQKHIAIYNQLESLLVELDTVTAVDSIQTLLSMDSLVDWADGSVHGLCVQYENGMRGIIDIDPIEPDEYGNSNNFDSKLSRQMNVSSFEMVVPQSTRTIFLSPCYADWPSIDSYIQNFGNQKLGQLGYDNFVMPIPAQCDLSAFCGLSDYGIIILSSHSIEWPATGPVLEIYLVTGELVNSQTNKKYFENIIGGQIPMYLRTLDNRYAISPEFFGQQNKNMFKDSKTFVYLAFCSSDKGGWTNTIINTCGAAASLGFDETVKSGRIRDKAVEFFSQMGDINRGKPLTLSEWYSGIQTSWTDSGVNVNLVKHGCDDFALWSKYVYVMATNPVDGATGVPVNTIISAAFSETMNPATLNSAIFKINNGAVSGSIQYSDQAVCFIPGSNLSYNTTYTARITTGAEDIYGNKLEEDYSWSFKTAGQGSANCISVHQGGWEFGLVNDNVYPGYIFLLFSDGDLTQNACYLSYDEDHIFAGNLDGSYWEGSNSIENFTFQGHFIGEPADSFNGSLTAEDMTVEMIGYYVGNSKAPRRVGVENITNCLERMKNNFKIFKYDRKIGLK